VAQNDKEKGIQKDKFEVKSTKKVIRLFWTHLFFFKNGKNWVKVSSSKSRLQAKNVKKQEGREVENKKPTLNLTNEDNQTVFSLFLCQTWNYNLTAQNSSWKKSFWHWNKPIEQNVNKGQNNSTILTSGRGFGA